MDRRKPMEDADADGDFREDTEPNGHPNAWQKPRSGEARRSDFSNDEFEDGSPESESNGAPYSMPPAEPGLLSGWAERSINRPDEEGHDSDPGSRGQGEPDPSLLDSNQLDEWADSQGDTLLTKMDDMDWDEEEARTTLRDASTILPPSGQGAALQSLPQRGFQSRQAPAPSRAIAREGSDGADGQNDGFPFRQPPSPVPGSVQTVAPPSFAYGHGPNDAIFSAFGRPPSTDSGSRKVWYGLAAITGVALAFVAHAFLGPTPPGTVIVVTKPSDATVLVDGQALAGQSSPFTVQGLSPTAEHKIEVRRDGFIAQARTVSVAGGEVKTLPDIRLEPLPVLTGFALTSVPPGATVFVDDRKLERTTPIRVTDLAPGPHPLRLELEGYKPWQTQIVADAGQIIELPVAQLVLAPQTRKSAWAMRMAARREAALAATESAADAAGTHRRGAAAGSRSSKQGSAAKPSASDDELAAEDVPEKASASARDDTATDDEASDEPAKSSARSSENGLLSINSRPWSQVTIDGKPIGNTPQLRISLKPGRHKVKLVNPELHITRGFAVEIEAGQTTTKTIEFGE